MAHLEIQLIAMLVAVACSIPGTFLVLRKMTMVTDAITHTILLGIVLGFLVVQNVHSPILSISAVAMGVVTVWAIEMFTKTKQLSSDAAIGIVFPFLFSLAILLISRYTSSIHLDIDSVLLGELAFAPFHRLRLFGVDIGPLSMYTMGAIVLVNLTLVLLFFKEIKLAIFSPEIAMLFGFSPTLLFYGLMTSVSLTTVGAFEAVGAILVIAFIVGPPLSAYLLTTDLKRMIWLSIGIGIWNAIIGYQFAIIFDVSIAGSMAVSTGITFMVIFCVTPKHGLLSGIYIKRQQLQKLACQTILTHVYYYGQQQTRHTANGVVSIERYIQLRQHIVRRALQQLINEGKLQCIDGYYELTIHGYETMTDY